LRRKTLTAIVLTAVITAATTFALTSSQYVLGWPFVSQTMIRHYVVAILACKEDLHRGADALAELERTYGAWRRDLLPRGISSWVTRCEELGPFPAFVPDIEQWMK
jgi:hypothetical protein